MQVDIEKYKVEGSAYLETVIKAARKEAWEELKREKLSAAAPEDLQILESIWSHGFMMGGTISFDIAEQLRNQ